MRIYSNAIFTPHFPVHFRALPRKLARKKTRVRMLVVRVFYDWGDEIVSRELTLTVCWQRPANQRGKSFDTFA